jgi:hypothetical protein
VEHLRVKFYKDTRTLSSVKSKGFSINILQLFGWAENFVLYMKPKYSYLTIKEHKRGPSPKYVYSLSRIYKRNVLGYYNLVNMVIDSGDP